mmetsp:Transcript_6129/g.20995  ORF Transcript_6129/g.20995 Transcript_6129/m.20995 type:complete len:615 (-) Transcript_6129:44-1888(-)
MMQLQAKGTTLSAREVELLLLGSFGAFVMALKDDDINGAVPLLTSVSTAAGVTVSEGVLEASDSAAVIVAEYAGGGNRHLANVFVQLGMPPESLVSDCGGKGADPVFAIRLTHLTPESVVASAGVETPLSREASEHARQLYSKDFAIHEALAGTSGYLATAAAAPALRDTTTWDGRADLLQKGIALASAMSPEWANGELVDMAVEVLENSEREPFLLSAKLGIKVEDLPALVACAMYRLRINRMHPLYADRGTSALHRNTAEFGWSTAGGGKGSGGVYGNVYAVRDDTTADVARRIAEVAPKQPGATSFDSTFRHAVLKELNGVDGETRVTLLYVGETARDVSTRVAEETDSTSLTGRVHQALRSSTPHPTPLVYVVFSNADIEWIAGQLAGQGISPPASAFRKALECLTALLVGSQVRLGGRNAVPAGGLFAGDTNKRMSTWLSDEANRLNVTRDHLLDDAEARACDALEASGEHYLLSILRAIADGGEEAWAARTPLGPRRTFDGATVGDLYSAMQKYAGDVWFKHPHKNEIVDRSFPGAVRMTTGGFAAKGAWLTDKADPELLQLRDQYLEEGHSNPAAAAKRAWGHGPPIKRQEIKRLAEQQRQENQAPG